MKNKCKEKCIGFKNIYIISWVYIYMYTQLIRLPISKNFVLVPPGFVVYVYCYHTKDRQSNKYTYKL